MELNDNFPSGLPCILKHGDCRTAMDKLAACSIDLTVTSPPYSVGKEYEQGVTHAEWQQLMRDVLDANARVLKPGGFCVINVADILCFQDAAIPRIQAAKPRLGLTKETVRAAAKANPGLHRKGLASMLGVSEQTIQRRLEDNNVRGGKSTPQTRVRLCGPDIEAAAYDVGLYLYDRRIWKKDPSWANSQWHSSSYRSVDEFEHLFVFWKPGIVEIKRERLQPGEWGEWGSRGVWDIPSVRSNDSHPAMFPVELPLRMIKLLTDHGAVVLDPFMGSGTTGVACANTGRKFIGIEKDATYFEIARHRIDTALAANDNQIQRNLV